MNLIKSFKKEYQSICSFLKHPVYQHQPQSFKLNIIRFAIVLLTNLVAALLIGGLIFLLDVLGLKDVTATHKLLALFEKFPLWLIFFLGVVIAPFFEELVFRFPLKLRRWVLHILFPLFIIVLFSLLIIQDNLILLVITGLVFALILILYIVYNTKILDYTERIWEKKFNWVFYTSAILFALVHITNYELSLTILLLSPILVASQFIGGLLMGYLRVKSGFLWGLALHMLFNAIVILPLIVSVTSAFPPVSIENENYFLTIDRGENTIHRNEFSSFSDDTIRIESHRFKKCLSLLLDKDERFIEFEFPSNDERSMLLPSIRLDINYENKSNGDKNTLENNKQLLLNELQNAYNFTLETYKKEMPLQELYIKDSLKLEPINNPEGNSLSISTFYKYINMENGTIDDLVNGLNNSYSKGDYFVTKIALEDRFNLKFNKMNSDSLKPFFEKNYGLSFKAINEEVAYTKLVFK